MGCDDATITFLGPQTQYVGLDQVNLLLPRTLIGKGLMNVVLSMDGQATNPVQINIK
ncbi:MAG: hypothetical protein U0Y68_11855 [Blastocatellia bacterium]